MTKKWYCSWHKILSVLLFQQVSFPGVYPHSSAYAWHLLHQVYLPAKISKLGNLLQVWPTHPRAGCHGRQLRSRQVTDILLLEFSFLVHHICPFLYTTGSRQLQRCKHLINPPSTLNHCVKRPNVSLPFVLCSLIHRTAQHQPWIYVSCIQTF